jgi:hypothetical protein
MFRGPIIQVERAILLTRPNHSHLNSNQARRKAGLFDLLEVVVDQPEAKLLSPAGDALGNARK